MKETKQVILPLGVDVPEALKAPEYKEWTFKHKTIAVVVTLEREIPDLPAKLPEGARVDQPHEKDDEPPTLDDATGQGRN